MNKAKLFLTAIGVFAIVGGALAFKAKSAFTQQYCTTTQLQSGNTGCSEQRALKTDTNGTSYFYVVKGAGSCNADRVCNSISTKFSND